MTKENQEHSEILETIDVEVPVRTAYNQWTQFEEFPRFMLGVKFVKQLDDTNLLWCIDIGEETRECDVTGVPQLEGLYCQHCCRLLRCHQ